MRKTNTGALILALGAATQAILIKDVIASSIWGAVTFYCLLKWDNL